MTRLTEYFKNLEPGTIYHISIRYCLDIAGMQIQSDWQVAETKCNRELTYLLYTLLIFTIY